MSLSYGSEHRWRHMATVEVGCNVADFAQLIQDDALELKVEPAGKSPPGVQWFVFFMDLSTGERRAARTAWAVLTALKHSAKAGFIPGFRVVDGQRWLALGDDRDTGEHETSSSVPAIRTHAWRCQDEGDARCAR